MAAAAPTDRQVVIDLARNAHPELFTDSLDGPGRLQGVPAELRELAVALDAMYGGGFDDEQTGDADTTGHYSRTDRWILATDSNGFLTVDEYPTEHDAQQVFDSLRRDYDGGNG